MIRGWCPSLHEPMATGDGLLVRVKPPLGQLSAAQAVALADAAASYGNGQVELTGRGALQVRGLDAAGARRFAAVVVALRLAVADAAAERRRTVLVSPLAGCDPEVSPGTLELARALEAAVVRDEGLAALPAKFRFAVDGGGALPLGDAAEVTLRLGPEGCVVGEEVLPPERAVAAALRLALQHPARVVAGPERQAVGPLAGGRAFGAGIPFGSMDAATLAGLGRVAEQGDGLLRLTPWRAAVIAGVRNGEVLAALGLVVLPDDPALRVSACAGMPGCAAASVATRVLARQLRPAPGMTTHVSGCNKGCAHPGPAALTFVGRDGLFDLVRNGRASDLPVARGLRPGDVVRVS